MVRFFSFVSFLILTTGQAYPDSVKRIHGSCDHRSCWTDPADKQKYCTDGELGPNIDTPKACKRAGGFWRRGR